MLRFVAPDPAAADPAATADFYHVVLLADAIDESLVTLARVGEGKGRGPRP